MNSENPSSSGCPVVHDNVSSVSGCPVPHDSRNLNPLTNEEKVVYFGQTTDVAGVKHDTESTHGLSTVAVASRIPKGGNAKEDETWVYPSPQRFYNAMKKKGWEPRAEEMSAVVSVHNTINERTWREVMDYEQLHTEYVHCRCALFHRSLCRLACCFSFRTPSLSTNVGVH